MRIQNLNFEPGEAYLGSRRVRAVFVTSVRRRGLAIKQLPLKPPPFCFSRVLYSTMYYSRCTEKGVKVLPPTPPAIYRQMIFPPTVVFVLFYFFPPLVSRYFTDFVLQSLVLAYIIYYTRARFSADALQKHAPHIHDISYV